MASRTIAERVAQLESEMIELRKQLRSSPERAGKDWRRSIEAFADDEDLQSVFAEAMKLRELDRKRARGKNSKSRNRRP